MSVTAEEILNRLKALANPAKAAGLARFGIQTGQAYGISVPALRRLAKEVGHDHRVAQALWKSGLHEARILASLVDDPAQVTEAQLERWVKDFDAWDICDQCCLNLFRLTPYAYRKVGEWSQREEEFVKRAAFALLAVLAMHDRSADDEVFRRCLPLIKRAATADRNFVKKAVNWALRQIGKSRPSLRAQAIQTAKEIQHLEAPSARWIAADALRELA